MLTPREYSTREILDAAGEAARQKMADLGTTEADVAEAVARGRRQR